MHWFWSGFWPNVAATLVGVVVGVPIALWLNSLSGRSVAKAQRLENQHRLGDALKSIRAALIHNCASLKAMLAVLATARAPLDTNLDVAAWEAARGEITPLLRNPDLNRRLALHFDQLATLSRLSVMHLETFAGVASALNGIAQTREALCAHLLQMAGRLLSDSAALEVELEPLLASSIEPNALYLAEGSKKE